MELATLAEFRYVPEFMGNRDQPDDERGSLTMMPLSALDMLIEYPDEEMRRWAKERIGPIAKQHPRLAQVIERFEIESLVILRRVDEHCKAATGFLIHGEEEADIVTLCLMSMYTPIKVETSEDDPTPQMPFLLHLNNALGKASNMTGEELGNWTALFDGSATPTNTSATGAAEGASQENADTTEDQTAESS